MAGPRYTTTHGGWNQGLSTSGLGPHKSCKCPGPTEPRRVAQRGLAQDERRAKGKPFSSLRASRGRFGGGDSNALSYSDGEKLGDLSAQPRPGSRIEVLGDAHLPR